MSSAQLIVALCVVLIVIIVFYLITSKHKEHLTTPDAASSPSEFKFPAAGGRLPNGLIFTKQMKDDYEAFGIGNPIFVPRNNEINGSLQNLVTDPKATPEDVIWVLNLILTDQLYNPYIEDNTSLLYPILNMSMYYNLPKSNIDLFSAVRNLGGNISRFPVDVEAVVATLNKLIVVLSSANLSQLQANAMKVMGPQHNLKVTLKHGENQLRAIISQLQTCAALLQRSSAYWQAASTASKK
jgi:type IV secretory pathway VirB3-like protein